MAETYVRPFPLFNTLQNELAGRINTGWVCPTREKIALIISQLEREQAEHIALLLIHYYFSVVPHGGTFISEIYDNRKGPKNIPFGARVSSGGKGVSFDINQVPNDLLMILAQYCGL